MQRPITAKKLLRMKNKIKASLDINFFIFQWIHNIYICVVFCQKREPYMMYFIVYLQDEKSSVKTIIQQIKTFRINNVKRRNMKSATFLGSCFKLCFDWTATVYDIFNCWTSCSSYYINAAKIYFQFSGTKKRVKLAAGESLNNK